ncbi:MAG: hypothetical protein AB7I27_15590 [Bacteriovoracaceae bacterium]
MKTNNSKLTNMEKMDNLLDGILRQVAIVYSARRGNANAHDDDLAETWATFRTEAEKLQTDISQVVTYIQLEESKT